VRVGCPKPLQLPRPPKREDASRPTTGSPGRWEEAEGEEALVKMPVLSAGVTAPHACLGRNQRGGW